MHRPREVLPLLLGPMLSEKSLQLLLIIVKSVGAMKCKHRFGVFGIPIDTETILSLTNMLLIKLQKHTHESHEEVYQGAE